MKWNNRMTNEQVLKSADEGRTLMGRINESKGSSLGHVMRMGSVLKELWTATEERERRRLMMIDSFRSFLI